MPGHSAMDLKRAKDKDIKLLKHDVNYLMQTWVIAQSALRGGKKVSKKFQYELRQLDEERKNYQNAISEAIRKAGINTCSECKGRCCYIGRKDESRFYAIDYWLRNYTLYPIPDQDEIYLKHPLIVWPRQVLENVKKYIRFQYNTKTEELRCRVKNDDRFASFVKLVGIPDEAGHRFRTKPATHSDASRPPRVDPFTELKATLVKPSSSR